MNLKVLCTGSDVADSNGLVHFIEILGLILLEYTLTLKQGVCNYNM